MFFRLINVTEKRVVEQAKDGKKNNHGGHGDTKKSVVRIRTKFLFCSDSHNELTQLSSSVSLCVSVLSSEADGKISSGSDGLGISFKISYSEISTR